MKRLIVAIILAGTAAAGLQAQQQPGARTPRPMPGPGAMGRRGGGPAEDPARFLLGHTGEFRLTDAQVTRLAAIARRSAERRQALRAQMDSMRPERRPGGPGARPDSAARAQSRQRFEQMRPALDRMRAQAQADRRDAIAVLTPDQQAQAWERIATAGRGQRGGMRRGMRPDGMRQGGMRPRGQRRR